VGPTNTSTMPQLRIVIEPRPDRAAARWEAIGTSVVAG
jgi:hypothetical protein